MVRVHSPPSGMPLDRRDRDRESQRSSSTKVTVAILQNEGLEVPSPSSRLEFLKRIATIPVAGMGASLASSGLQSIRRQEFHFAFFDEQRDDRK